MPGSSSVSVSWSNLNVWSRTKDGNVKAILQNVHGYAKPNRLLAVMGASGAGKSTLLQALVGRLNPELGMSGSIKGES